MNIDEYLLRKVKKVDPGFAEYLRLYTNGSLAIAFESVVDRQVENWIEKHSAMQETDPRWDRGSGSQILRDRQTIRTQVNNLKRACDAHGKTKIITKTLTDKRIKL